MTESPLERLLDSGAPLPLAMLRAAIDSADLSDLFAHWQQHTQLADSYEWALKWGLAHRRAPGGAD